MFPRRFTCFCKQRADWMKGYIYITNWPNNSKSHDGVRLKRGFQCTLDVTSLFSTMVFNLGSMDPPWGSTEVLYNCKSARIGCHQLLHRDGCVDIWWYKVLTGPYMGIIFSWATQWRISAVSINALLRVCLIARVRELYNVIRHHRWPSPWNITLALLLLFFSLLLSQGVVLLHSNRV